VWKPRAKVEQGTRNQSKVHNPAPNNKRIQPLQNEANLNDVCAVTVKYKHFEM